MKLICVCFLSSLCFYVSLASESSSKLTSPTRLLSNGYKIPIVGFGTHFRTPTEEAEAIMNAIETGYRHFDTAYFYKNEKNLGNVLKKWFDKGGKREDFFITTKLPPQGIRPGDVEIYLNKSLENFGFDYIDMYMIHTPFGLERKDDFDTLYHEDGTVGVDYSTDLVAVWKAMEKQVKAGRIRSIGLSSFNASQILRIWKNAEIKPTNLQLEENLYIQQKELHELCDKLNIVITAFSPLGSNNVAHVRRKRDTDNNKIVSPLNNEIVKKIAKKHDRSVGQVLLRYSLQLGYVIIPSTSKPARMRENLDLFNFTLDRQDMKELAALDKKGRVRKFDFQTLFPGSNKHPEYPFRQ